MQSIHYRCKAYWLLGVLLLGLSLSAQAAKLSEPLANQEQILEWSLKAVKAINTYSYSNYQARLRAASEYFTFEGWRDYSEALERSKNLNILRNQKMHICATPKGKGRIIQAGILRGRYQWQIVIPAMIQYQNDEKTIQQQVEIHLLVVRTADTKSGVGISQYIAVVKN